MVIYTYSVIIQNAKTMEAFTKYQPLFNDALNSNRIGVCKWNESGTTIETALPELSSLTDDKEEWRAIIVRFIDDNCMAMCKSAQQNPYDFLINQEQSDEVRENDVPLVRLTQMLGGVPPLEVKFKPEIIKEEHKAPRTIYTPIVDEEKEQAHQSLVKKYQFDGKAPLSIIIVTVRDLSGGKEDNIGRAWLSHKESESSEFWKRNQYPSTCRFLVYDYEKLGPIQRDADDFNFWLSVMLLSTNEIDSATLQAYRLYTVKTVIDKKVMSESFQAVSDRLRDAKQTLERDIRKDIENQICDEEELPEYRIEVPVALKLPAIENREVKKSSFHLLSDGALSDVAIWNKQCESIEDELVKTVRSAERTLDQTADKMRDACSFEEDEVEPLNKYQEEDMLRETDELYHNVVNIQSGLPTDKVSDDEEIVDSSESVKENLVGRVLKKPAIIAFVIAALFLLLSSLPAIIQKARELPSELLTLTYIMLGVIVIVIGFGLVALIAQKIKLNKLIKKYNQSIKTAFNKLIENADDYSKYMSAIASHSRGSSYLALSARKKYFHNEEHYSRYKHIKAINVLLSRLKGWSKAYHLDVDFTSKRPEERVEIDITQTPFESKFYAINSGDLYPVAVNNSGMSVESPFNFIARIEIDREELYDD